VAVSDGPSGGSSFLGLFLGGISHVFSRAHKRWAPMLGSFAGGYQTPIGKENRTRTRKRKWH
jgi:hypothetical protein